MTHKHTLKYLLVKHDNGEYSGDFITLGGCFAVGKDMKELIYYLKHASKGYFHAFPDVHNKLCKEGKLPTCLGKHSFGTVLSVESLTIDCTAPQLRG